MAADKKRPLVGLGVLVLKGSKVLIGERKSPLGAGHFALPGGHLEYGESFEECARREVLEETGLDLGTVAFVTAQNSIFGHGSHYVTIFMRAEVTEDAEAQNLEPEKCCGWMWCEWSQLPAPLFQPLQQLINSGYTPVPNLLAS